MKYFLALMTFAGSTMISTLMAAPHKEEMVLVAGATGGTGQLIVKALLEKGYPVRAFVRNATKAQILFADEVEIVVGDVRDTKQVEQAMQGVKYLFSAIGARTQDDADPNSGQYVDYLGTRHLVEAARKQDVQQIIVISSAGLSRSVFKESAKQRPILKWKLRGEQSVKGSQIPYTIIRPGGLSDTAGGKMGVRATQGNYRRAMIPREDVAKVSVAALKNPAAYGKTFEIVSDDQAAPVTDWDAFYSVLQPDSAIIP